MVLDIIVASWLAALGSLPGSLIQCEVQKLTPSDPQQGSSFGHSVSISGDVAILGQPQYDCTDGPFCGFAYVYRWNGTSWNEEQKLMAASPGAFDRFGYSVSIDGNAAIIGNPGNREVYVFRWNGLSWSQEQILTPSDPATELFGHDVAISGNAAIVSASGGALVFRWNGTSWAIEQQLTTSVGTSGLGFPVSIDGDVALVGSQLTVSVFVFRRNGVLWMEEQRLTPTDAPAELFGRSIDIDGDAAIVGADFDDCADDTLRCGSAYIYRWNGTSWNEEQKLIASNQKSGDEFGWSVGINGDTAVVGVPGSNCGEDIGGLCGAAYVYRWNGTSWAEERKLIASDGNSTDILGYSVAFDGQRIISGATGDLCSDFSVNCGSAYAFVLASMLDCNENGVEDTCDLTEGMSEDCNDNGIPDDCEVPPICPSCFDCNLNGVPDGCESFTCDDDNLCTTDSCNGVTCLFVENANPCDDGSACTLNDRCNDGLCIGSPQNCDDGLFCTGIEICDLSLGCRTGMEPCPPELECNESTDACLPPAIPTTSTWGLVIICLMLFTGAKIYRYNVS